MLTFLKNAAKRLPVASQLAELRELREMSDQYRKLGAKLARNEEELNRLRAEQVRVERAPAGGRHSVDVEPWRHPFLTAKNLSAFRQYSERVWQFARDYAARHPGPLSAAFTVNMCQNMYKWASLAKARGVRAVLFPHIMDTTALSRPEWEEFDGEYERLADGAGFLEAHPGLRTVVPFEYLPIASEGGELLESWLLLQRGERDRFARLLGEAPGLRHEALLTYQGFYTYYTWAKRLSTFDVVYGCSNPFAAYASGRPYMVASVGGDLIFDCGRDSDFGRAHLASFSAARYQTASNPHTLAHCRRLGITNPIYMPYPMDDKKYKPGIGLARREWNERYGEGVYVLAPSRIDSAWKGFDATLLEELRATAKLHPLVRFVFLGWGENQQDVREWIAATGLSEQFIVLKPVGKLQLIDYYRSCDIVLDHFVWGYYGATALEAAAIGRPVVMKLRTEHYHPLYAGDVAPVNNVSSPAELFSVLSGLIGNVERRKASGEAMRQWLLRNHSEDFTMPILMALLRLTADEVVLPPELRSPLLDDVSEEERAYHESCIQTEP